METEIDVKKITENDAKKAKTLTWIQVLTKDLTKKKKVMWLVKLVNYWEIAINTQSVWSNLLNHEDILYRLYLSGFQTPVYWFGHPNYVPKLKKNWCKTTATI